MPSLASSVGAAERRFLGMTRKMRVGIAATKAEMRGLNAAASPILGLAAAGGLMFGFKQAIGKSSALAHEIQNLKNAGRSTNEIARGMLAANAAIRALPTTTLIDNLRVLNETTGAFGSFQHAVENLSFNQKIGSMMQNILGEHAGEPGEMFNNIVRAMEMRGSAQDHTRYQREVGELYKSMIFTGGRVNGAELFNFAQQANPYIKGYSLRYLSRIAPSLIQEFGGDKAGTMANTWTGTILGKAKNKISTEAWIKLGLLDPKQVVYNKVGPVGWRPGAVTGTNMALQDPLKWTETVLIPALRRHGFRTDDQLSLAKALMPLFRDRNANRLANVLTYDLDRKRLHKDESLIGQVPNADKAYQDTLRRDPLLAWNATKSSFTNLSSVLFGTGKGESPVAVALVHVANGVNMLVGVIERHPWLGQGLGAALGLTAGIATLKVFGVALTWLLSPLRIIGPLLRKLASTRLAGVFANGLIRLGPVVMRGLMAIGPWLLRGLAMAFGLLSNPVGWAILAGSAILLVVRYREAIARGWNALVAWFRTSAWPAIGGTVDAVLSWGGRLVDKLIAGLAGAWPRLKNWLSSQWASSMPTWLGGVPASGKAKASSPATGSGALAMWAIAGARAGGGGVRAGGSYLVGEQGPEIVRFGRTGFVTPADLSARAMAGVAATGQDGGARPAAANDRGRAGATFNIYGATDPQAVARAVDERLRWYEREQDAYLSD
jgi:hypothetical protein